MEDGELRQHFAEMGSRIDVMGSGFLYGWSPEPFGSEILSIGGAVSTYDDVMRRLRELAEQNRPNPPLSHDEVMERLREFVAHNRPDPPPSYDEVMQKLREIAQRGR